MATSSGLKPSQANTSVHLLLHRSLIYFMTHLWVRGKENWPQKKRLWRWKGSTGNCTRAECLGWNIDPWCVSFWQNICDFKLSFSHNNIVSICFGFLLSFVNLIPARSKPLPLHLQAVCAHAFTHALNNGLFQRDLGVCLGWKKGSLGSKKGFYSSDRWYYHYWTEMPFIL